MKGRCGKYKRLLWAIFPLFISGAIFFKTLHGITIDKIPPFNKDLGKSEQNFDENHVFIIARAHKNQPKRQIQAFVYSLLAQTHKNFTLWIVNGENPSEEVFGKDISGFKDNRVSSVAFRYKRSINFSHSFGYYTTDLALKKIVSITHSEDRNNFLLVTNGDNLYHSQFLENSLKLLDERTCFVASDWVSRYAISTSLPNQAEEVLFKLGRIGLGCALSSLFHIRQTYKSGTYFKKNEYTADWLFFEQIIKTFGSDCVKKTERVLFIHQ